MLQNEKHIHAPHRAKNLKLHSSLVGELSAAFPNAQCHFHPPLSLGIARFDSK